MTRRTLTAKDIMPNSDNPERELRELRDSVLASFPDRAPPRALPAELQGYVPVAAPPTESDELSTNTDDYELEERPERIFATPSPQGDVAGLCERLHESSRGIARWGSLYEHQSMLDKAAALLQAQAEELEQSRADVLYQARQHKAALAALQQENDGLREALALIRTSLRNANERFLTSDFDDKQHGYIVADWIKDADDTARAALERQT